MKVQASRISNSVAFIAKGEIPVEDLNAFMAENAEECLARFPVTYDLSLVHKKGGIRLTGKISALLYQDCVRCNKRDEVTLNLEPDVLLVDVADSPKDDEIVLGADDLDVVFYNNDTIDIHHIVLETVWSELDGIHLCKDDCLGLCPICGQNLNDGNCGCTQS